MEGSEPCPEGVELKGKGGNPQKYPNLRVPGDTQPAHVSACMAYDGTPPQKKKPAQASPHMGDPQPPRLQQRGEQPHALFHAGLVEEREVEPHRVAVAAIGIEERPRHVCDPSVQGLVV